MTKFFMQNMGKNTVMRELKNLIKKGIFKENDCK